jgi:hypothetical protein
VISISDDVPPSTSTHMEAALSLPTAPFVMPQDAAAVESGLSRMAFALADRAVVADIGSECPRLEADGRSWFDTRPMTDPREHAPSVVDMANTAICYAIARQLVGIHPQRPYLLTFNRKA